MHISAPKREKCTFCSKVLPGPLGPLWLRAKPGDYSRIRRCFFRILTEMQMLWNHNFTSFILLRNHLARLLFTKKACARHFARNLTIVSPNGGRGGQNHPKCEKVHNPIFLRKRHLLAPKVRFGSFSAFWAFLHFRLQMTQKSIKKPLLPQAFEPLVPENAFWAPNCTKAELCSNVTF